MTIKLVPVAPYRVFVARNAKPVVQHVATISKDGTVTALCGHFWRPERSPHVLTDAFESRYAVCSECKGRAQKMVRAQSDDGKTVVKLESRSLDQPINASGPNRRMGFDRHPYKLLRERGT